MGGAFYIDYLPMLKNGGAIACPPPLGSATYADGRTFRYWIPKLKLEISWTLAVCDDRAYSSVSNKLM